MSDAKRPSRPLAWVTRIAVLAGLGFLLTLIEFPILPAFQFLKYDPSEVPAMLASFSLGPVAGVLVEGVKTVIFALSGKNTTGLTGAVAMFLAGASFVLAAGLVYKRMRSRSGAVIALTVGTLAQTAVMCAANYWFLLAMWGVPAASRLGYVQSAILPFNLLKGAITSVIVFLLYKRLSSVLHG